MAVMTARMHDTLVFRYIVEMILFHDWQPIHVRPHGHRSPGFGTLDVRHYCRLGDPTWDKTEGSQFRLYFVGCLKFIETQLWMPVKVPPQRHNIIRDFGCGKLR